LLFKFSNEFKQCVGFLAWIHIIYGVMQSCEMNNSFLVKPDLRFWGCGSRGFADFLNLSLLRQFCTLMGLLIIILSNFFVTLFCRTMHFCYTVY
jgi:hypothetical protein